MAAMIHSAGKRGKRGRPCWLLSVVLVLAVAGCTANRQLVTRSELTLPPLWKLTDWNGVRETRAEAWNRWARRHLLTGDVLFVTGENRVLLGLVDFSELSRDLTASEFSHVAVVAREGEGIFVYDTISTGPRRTEFGDFLADPRVWTVAVKRLSDRHRDRAEAAVEYCRKVVEHKPPFDTQFALENEGLYCSEMIELAFRSAGVALSSPERIDQLPGYTGVPDTTRVLIQAAAKIRIDQWVYVPGNAQLGIWACPYLDLVLPATDVREPPAVETAEKPAESVEDFLSASLWDGLDGE